MTEPGAPRVDRPAGDPVFHARLPEQVELAPGEVLVLEPGLAHALEAVRESGVLLTIAGGR